MKSQIQQLTASILLLSGTTAFAENSTSKVSVPSLLAEYMTQEYSSSKINALFEHKIFELDPTQTMVIIDAKKLHQAASLNQDQQLLKLVKSLQELVANESLIRVVDPKDMVASSQDRSGAM
jgi:hypothetical protein